MPTRIALLASLLAIAAFGCDKTNPTFCDVSHPDCGPGRVCDTAADQCVPAQDLGGADFSIPDGGADAGPMCSPACTGSAPICLAPSCVGCDQTPDGESACAALSSSTPHCLTSGVGTGSCVGCRDATDCPMPTASFCDQTTHQCRGCVNDAECPSLVCDETPGSATRGECIDKSQVVYVDVTPNCMVGNSGDFGMPICSINSAENIKNKSVIHVAAGNYSLENVVFNNAGTWTLVGADGAQIVQINAGKPALQVQGTTTLVVRNMTLLGNTTTKNGDGIALSGGAVLTVLQSKIEGNGGDGITSPAGCTLTVDRSQIFGNALGGMVIASNFDIRNSFIVGNGDMNASSLDGGVSIKAAPGLTATFINNTVADNYGSGKGSGISCMNPVSVLDTILYRNKENQGDTVQELNGSCTTLYTATDDATDAGRAGSNNLDLSTTSPAFASSTDYHLMPTSPCADKGTDSGMNDHDIDGQPRPDPTTKKVDIGADEVE